MDFRQPLSFEEFKEASLDAWKAQAQKELKTEDLTSLNWTNTEGIDLQPFYDTSDKEHLRAFDNRINAINDLSHEPRWWLNMPLVNVTNPANDNKIILEALQHGADGIVLSIKGSTNFQVLLEDVKQEYCSISLIVDEAATFFDYLNYTQEKSNLEKLSGSVFWTSLDEAKDFLKNGFENYQNSPVKMFGFYGDTPENQLIYIKELLRINPSIADKVSFSLEVTEDYFSSIAVLKAMRILAYHLIKNFKREVSPENLSINAFSPPYKNENYGPHENMLKSTTAGLAAVIGGCNALTIIPEKEDSPLQRRIARNVSNILKEESYLGKVMDPVAGSYYLDDLIDKTCMKIWKAYEQNQ